MRRFILLAFLAALVAGCVAKTQPARFYLLNPVPAARLDPKPGISVLVGPVELPDHLDRPQIVTRSGANEIGISEFNQWAGSLQRNFTITLADNLAAMLGTGRVHLYPSRSDVPIDFRVTVEVSRFDGTPGENARLSATWTLFRESGGRALVTRRAAIDKPVNGDTYKALVDAESRALADLAWIIANAIETFNTPAD